MNYGMNYLFEIGVNVFENFIAIMFLTLYLGENQSGAKKYVGIAAGTLFSAAIITVLNYHMVYEGILGLLMVFSYFLYALIFLKGDVYIKLFVSGLTDCIINTIGIITALAVNSSFIDFPASEVISIRFIQIAVSKLLFIAVCVVLLKFKFRKAVSKKNITALLVLTLIAEILTTEIAEIFLDYESIKPKAMIIMFGVTVIIVISYYIFIKINYEAELEREYYILKCKYDRDMKNAEDIKELYERICGIRHDIGIYFNTILLYLDEDTDKAKKYICDLIKDRLETGDFIETENIYLDSVINTKTAICEKEGIHLEIKLAKNALDILADDEIGVLFGNLFDNAIKASKNSSEKSIFLEVKRHGDYISILMLNSIKESVLKSNVNLETTKEDEKLHGFGIKNIRRIVKNHDGIIEFFEKDNKFGCHILLLDE